MNPILIRIAVAIVGVVAVALLLWKVAAWMRSIRIGDWITFPWILGIAWLVFLWQGYAWFKSQPTNPTAPFSSISECLPATQKRSLPHGTANQAMPVNWRIGTGDVTWKGGPRLAGQYIRCVVSAGDPMVAQDLEDKPIISPANGKLGFRLEAPIDDWNSGMTAQIFDGNGPPLVESAKVLGVISDGADALYFELTSEEALALERARGKLSAVRRK